MFGEVKDGHCVLLIWSGTSPPKKIEEIVHQLNSVVGPAGKVAVEHEERLKLCKQFLRLVIKLNSFSDYRIPGLSLSEGLLHRGRN